MAGFDVNAARQAGYSDDEILAHLTQTRGFDVSGALKTGYSKPEVIDYLSTNARFAANAPGVPRPTVNMQEGPDSVLGGTLNRLGDTLAQTGRSPLRPTAQDTQFYQQHPGAATAAGVGGLAAGAAAAGAPAAASAALPFLRQTAANTVKAIPYVAASEAIRHARSIPFLGKLIPPGAEWLPYVFGGRGKEAPEAAAEDEAATAGSTDQTPGRPYQPNPRYQPQPEPEPLPQRNGPLLLNGEVAPPQRVSRQQVSQAVDSSLDVQPQQRNAPIYNRGGSTAPAPQDAPAVPEMTPVKSSALSSYGYDPQAQEFHAVMNSNPNTTYVYGDVSPDQVEAFENAGSKGKAFQSEIRGKGSVPVAQINNSTGKRTAIIPTRRF